MHFLSILLLAAPLVSALGFNPPAEALTPLTDANVAAAFPELATPSRRLTNGERLARGLPLAAPRRVVASRTRKEMAARAGPSPTAVAGTISVHDDAGHALGFVGSVMNIFGEYGLTTDTSATLSVSALAPADGSAFAVTAGNGAVAASLPFVGAINGLANEGEALGPASFNYAYLGGVATAGAPGSPPQPGPNSFTTATGIPESSEGTIWTYDALTGELLAHWTNPDGSAAPVQLAYYAPDNVFILVGDLDAFEAAFGAGTASLVHLIVSA